MAQALDKTIFTALTVILAFAVTRSATGNIPLAMLVAALAPYPAHLAAHLLRRRYERSGLCLFRRRRRLSAQTVRCWAVERDDACLADALNLLRAAYPASAARLRPFDGAAPEDIPVQLIWSLHPVGEDAMADRLCALRGLGCARAVIASTSEFTAEARALTLLPHMPAVALIDGAMLAALLAKHPQAATMRALPRIRAPRPQLTRAHALRMIPAAAFLLGMYLMFGLALYLPAGLALTWCILMLLKRRRAPDALFSE